MKRLLPLSLLLAGCGGHGGYGTPDPTPVPAATLGSAKLDLAIAGNVGVGNLPYGTSMSGTGAAEGSLSIVDVGQAQAGALQVSAALFPTSSQGTALGQTFVLTLAHREALAVGAKFTLGDGASSATYTENASWTSAPIAGDGIARTWAASGGTVEVAALSGTTTTLRLKDIVLQETGTSTPTPLALSGTITGTVTLPVM